jgi:hypothetical protein
MPCTALYILSCEFFVQGPDDEYELIWDSQRKIKSEFSTSPSATWFLIWQYFHNTTMEYYSVIKNEILSFKAKWMELEDIMLK